MVNMVKNNGTAKSLNHSHTVLSETYFLWRTGQVSSRPPAYVP